MIQPHLNWDIGTVYDLFISLRAMHRPNDFGLRASWAAGVRSRLSSELRDTLELANNVIQFSLLQIYNLPKPKNAATLLHCIELTPPADRLPKFFFSHETNPAYRAILMNTLPGKKWTATETKIVRQFSQSASVPATSENVNSIYKAWSNRKEFGEKYLAALKAYVENFYEEEENRIMPSLLKGLAHAQSRAGSLPLTALLEELSLGVRFMEMEPFSNLVLTPSFWVAPYIIYEHLDAHTMIMLFGARPDDMALVPGEIVPESLIRALKALADPTRLRILRYLSSESQTPTQLARTLRLRAPTVIHHLSALRMAGLVQVLISPEGERQYTSRLEGFSNTQDILERFVNGD